MNSVFKSLCSLARLTFSNPAVVSKRFFNGSPALLKTIQDNKARPSTESLIEWDELPVPKKQAPDRWTPKKALFGENDYKDLLGDGTYPLRKNVKTGPFWLRGWKGNEFQRLIKKKQLMGNDLGPKAKKDLDKRIRFLYKRFNRNMGTKFYKSAMKD